MTKGAQHKSILVVEDEQPLQDAVRSKLEAEGFDVVSARTVEQAISAVDETDHLDAIWLDHYLLGKKNGLDFVVSLKHRGGRDADIPIFLVSNTASQDKVNSYRRLGVRKLYTKANHALAEIIEDLKAQL